MADTSNVYQKPLRLFSRVPTAIGNGGTYNPGKYNLTGYTRLAGVFRLSAGAAATGYPRILQSIDGTNTDHTTVLTADTTQATAVYTFDITILAPYVTFEFTNGVTPANLSADGMAYGIGGGSSSSGGSTPTTTVECIPLPLSINTIGDNTVIAAPGAGNSLRIYHIDYVTGAAVSVIMRSGATALSGTYPFPDIASYAFDAGNSGPIICGDNEAFIINLSAGVSLGGMILYTAAAT